MINISIGSDGNINISQESAEERAHMQRAYAEIDSGNTVVNNFQSGGDESQAYDAGFKGGWAAAVQETQLRFINGQLLDFYNEQGTPSYSMDGVSQVDLEQAAKEFEESYGSQDPHYQEPIGTGEEGWDETAESFVFVDGSVEGVKEDNQRDTTPAIEVKTENILFPRSASTQDPHSEEDTKEDPNQVEPGTWTMSNEELNSRINEAYRRGVLAGEQTKMETIEALYSRQVTRRTLLTKAQEVVAADTLRTFASGQGVPTPFHESFGDSVEGFVVPLAKALGFKVVD